MRSMNIPKSKRSLFRFHQMLWPIVLTIFLFVPASKAADVSHHVGGPVFSMQDISGKVESEATSGLPGVTPDDPEEEATFSDPIPLPGVTIELYSADTNLLLGTGKANREGFYNVSYMAPEATNTEPHNVWFLVYWILENAEKEFVGEVHQTLSGDPIQVTARVFPFELHVPTKMRIEGGTSMFSPEGVFVFTEVGDIDMDDIYDEQQDSGDSAKWGLTKPPRPESPDHTLGPDMAFGRTLELYGLFGETDTTRFYRINYTKKDGGVVTGAIADPLYKKNYVITGTGVDVHLLKMGPKPGPAGLTDVYELDERLVGELIDGGPDVYSSFWTELGLRARWNSRAASDGTPLPDGLYELSVEAWDAAGSQILPLSTNPFATLSLYLVNTPPVANIHNIQYLDGTIVLEDTNPCQTVVLNEITASPDDDSLQFLVTARHPAGFLQWYRLSAWYGHNSHLGDIAAETYDGVTTPDLYEQIVQTPLTITYHSCAYRFCLNVWPRITNGYHIIYRRQDNWYAAINVIGSP